MAQITIPEGATIQQSTRVVYSPPSLEDTFNVPYPFFDYDDLSVYVDGVLKTRITDYSVSGISVDGGYSSGTVVLSSQVQNVDVIIQRDVPVERLSDFLASGPFPMSQMNLTLDKYAAILQQLRTTVDRAVRLDDADSTQNVVLPTVANRANKYLYFDSVGTPVVAVATDLSSTGITAFGQQLIENASNTDARTDLDVYSQAQVDAAIAGISSDGRLLDVQIYTGNDTWTKPAGCTAIEVIVVSGGGGGGGASVNGAGTKNASAGSGGTSSDVIHAWWMDASSIAATATITVGAGGAGGAAGVNGADGTQSSFDDGSGNVIQAKSGKAGIGKLCTTSLEWRVGDHVNGVTGTQIITGTTDYVVIGGQDTNSGQVADMSSSTTTYKPVFAFPGRGANCPYGTGGNGKYVGGPIGANGASNGAHGDGYGSGGGGGGAYNGYSGGGFGLGGNGAGGLIIVKAYS